MHWLFKVRRVCFPSSAGLFVCSMRKRKCKASVSQPSPGCGMGRVLGWPLSGQGCRGAWTWGQGSSLLFERGRDQYLGRWGPVSWPLAVPQCAGQAEARPRCITGGLGCIVAVPARLTYMEVTEMLCIALSPSASSPSHKQEVTKLSLQLLHEFARLP